MYASEVLKIAEAEIGYKGKKSNAQLDDKEANVSGYYTKYSRDCYNNNQDKIFNGNKQGFSYCATFIYWCFLKALNSPSAVRSGKYIPYNDYCAGVNWVYKAFNDAKRIVTDPQPGDVIMFKDKDGLCHVGLVWKVDDTTVTTIEGNISKNVVSRTFKKTDSSIAYYGRPYYEAEPEPVEEIPIDIPVWETVWEDENYRLQKLK